ncbi:recombinase family protein [Tianweitania sediminis]|uniref:Recombinase family protein n=1 Tax=Tianweitania sediminis TaxID=1502156 RepID=A0A8J7R9E5_9HYPH|nr:recombinase family protein [Tianweitania sediminis]MBP0441280.1 recombinase family protein [Tianweitania sediminis]
MSAQPKLRCAIYTRKSTEEGLEQEFNSLDAQHEACAAYITSQIGLGWKLMPDRYDDGGLSGGSMERPALQRLLRDIRDGKVDVVVVYKIDRLTRSLMDFSRIVETFDSQNVSFVSITQQFNTTTSMGRLTLNVLLSFAQFEREVTAERIRDKVAASKKKGMWMGGTVPTGYVVKAKKLQIDQAGADEVRSLFSRYLEVGSVPGLVDILNEERARAATDENWKRVSKGKLYYMLANPLYIGKVRHGEEVHKGEHRPIIDEATFAEVQARLAEQAPRRKGLPVQKDIHLLNGILYDDLGDRMSPIHATKAGKRYRYYMSSRLKNGKRHEHDGWRIAAQEIEAIALHQLRAVLSDQVMLADWIVEHATQQQVATGLDRAAPWLMAIEQNQRPSLLRQALQIAIHRIELAQDRLRLHVSRPAIVSWLIADQVLDDGELAVTRRSKRTRSRGGRSKGRDASVHRDPADHHVIELPMVMKRRGIESRIVIEGMAIARKPDRPLVDMIAKAHAYLEAFTDGRGLDRKQVASRFRVHPEDVSRLLPLAFLSPRMVDAILQGRQPVDLSVRHLARAVDLPIAWNDQAELLSF